MPKKRTRALRNKENRLIIGQSQEINVSLQVISTQLIFWLVVWVL
jgi:hypothetical protein